MAGEENLIKSYASFVTRCRTSCCCAIQIMFIDHMGLDSQACWTQITTADLEKALVADDSRLKLNFDDFGMTSAPRGNLLS